MQDTIHPLSSLQATAAQRRHAVGGARPAGESDFRDVLRGRLDAARGAAAEPEGVQFSKHAAQRLQDRHIDLSPDDMNRLERATEMAARKGAREALMMLGNVNLIVSVRNRTVVTAMQPNAMEDRVFTNIDTAVMLGGNEKANLG